MATSECSLKNEKLTFGNEPLYPRISSSELGYFDEFSSYGQPHFDSTVPFLGLREYTLSQNGPLLPRDHLRLYLAPLPSLPDLQAASLPFPPYAFYLPPPTRHTIYI